MKKYIKDYLLILIICVFLVPWIFKFKLNTEFPPGYAGLYSQMAREVLDNRFSFPDFISYYGNGLIPFAYPPLAFYIMALTMKLTGMNFLAYTKFIPNIFLLISVAVFYFLAKKILKTRMAAFIASLFFISSSGIIGQHYVAEGMTRGLALMFTVASLYFLQGSEINLRKRVLAAFFWGLSALTHPSYAVFGVISTLATIMFYSQVTIVKKIKYLILFISVGFLVIAPWLYAVITLHGINPLVSAVGTHGTLAFTYYFRNFANFLTLFKAVVIPTHETVVLTGLMLVGVVYCLLSADFFLVIWLCFVLLVSGLEGQRFIAFVAALIAAKTLTNLIDLSFKAKVNRRLRSLMLVFIITLTVAISMNRMEEVTAYKSYLNLTAINQLGDWFSDRPSTPTYLLLSESDAEHEWMPYIIKAKPIGNPFGSEWIGDYAKQGDLYQAIIACAQVTGSACYNKVLHDIPVKPDYLVIRGDNKVGEKDLVFENSDYQVWKL